MMVSFPYPPRSQLWTPLSPTSVWTCPASPLSILRHSFAGQPASLVLAADALGASSEASASSPPGGSAPSELNAAPPRKADGSTPCELVGSAPWAGAAGSWACACARCGDRPAYAPGQKAV